MRFSSKLAVGIGIVVVVVGVVLMRPSGDDLKDDKSKGDGEIAMTDGPEPSVVADGSEATEPVGDTPPVAGTRRRRVESSPRPSFRPPDSLEEPSSHDPDSSDRTATGSLADGTENTGRISLPAEGEIASSDVPAEADSEGAAPRVAPDISAGSLAGGPNATTRPASGLTTRPAETMETVSSVSRAAPEPTPSPRIHVIAPGDTFSALAARYYGHAKHADLLVKANPGVEPRRLYVGAKITIPPAPESATATVSRTSDAGTGLAGTQPRMIRSLPPIPSNRAYTIQDRETWSSLAQRFLGSSSRWTELYEYNKERVGRNPHLLRVGTVIELPEDAPTPGG